MSKIVAKELMDEDRVIGTKTIEYEGRSIEVKPLLSYPEMLAYVNYVVDACFDDDTGEYKPEIRDFALRFATIELYTNIDLSDEYGNDYAYDFLYSIDDLLVDIKEVISQTQFASILEAIDSKISYVVESNVNEMVGKMNDLYNEIYSLVDALEKQFDSIDNEDMKRLIDAMVGTGFDTNKFVESYIESKGSGDE